VPEPKIVKKRGYLDLIIDSFDAGTERLLGMGTRGLSDVQRDKSRWTAFADVEGTEFDLIAG
jgi:Glyoxalase-like domain